MGVVYPIWKIIRGEKYVIHTAADVDLSPERTAFTLHELTKAYIDRCIRLGLRDSQVQATVKISIGQWGIEAASLIHYSETATIVAR